ncbi:MAG: 16S rRNA (guanine(527)-N(7))-methyltransferase RsmG [Bacteroidetes bacterium]|nr:16S rRNA (guanine(527)-N(7))-methyltransferase RsmG [Bacteroidota bacterium]
MKDNPIIIKKYFNFLSDQQFKQFSELGETYEILNDKVNLISRKDFSNLYTNHILHSLAIAKVIDFKANTRIIDVGTGGGFPGIPLAIMFPKVHFCLIDSIGKKIKAVTEIVNELKLANVEIVNIRSEDFYPDKKFDFIISRAVASIDTFYRWTKHLINKKSFNDLPNGILYLKGSNFKDEMKERDYDYSFFSIKSYFPDFKFFDSKVVLYLNLIEDWRRCKSPY